MLTISLRPMRLLLLPTLILMVGCSQPTDERLIEVSERACERQKSQNELIARQSEQATKLSNDFIDAEAQARQEVIELQRELAESEAMARAELFRTQQDLVERNVEGWQELTDLQRETQATAARQRESIDRQLEELEGERRQIAKERQRAPIIAAAIAQFGLVLACLAPLVLAAYLLHVPRHSSDDDAAVTELLVEEIVAARPKLLPRPGSPPLLPGSASNDHDA